MKKRKREKSLVYSIRSPNLHLPQACMASMAAVSVSLYTVTWQVAPQTFRMGQARWLPPHPL